MKSKKVLIPLVLLLVVAAVGAKMFLLPKKSQAKQIVNGTIYVLPKQFELNLSDGKYATMTVALLLAPGQSTGATAANADMTTPAGNGTLTQEPIIRAIVTSDVTNDSSRTLLTASGRAALQKEILHGIKTQTDVKVTKIYFTDLAIQ
ncbi:MAG TPA: flagellar basal body-associated FliL family protein [Solirubrobacteraceae bacterium]|nr:flagellar basal body-associated FliL family protein [Solirubrobacteraceae bacterium]